MDLFKKISQIFSPRKVDEERAHWVYVQCGRCGENIKVRVDLFNDLSPIYAEDGVTYFCRKVVIGQGRCYQKIEVEMNFDGRRKLTGQEIHFGQFISQEAFENGQTTDSSSPNSG